MIPGYEWLGSIGLLPRMIAEAAKLYGTIEEPGARKDNPIILGWAAELDLERVYTADAIPWCGLFVALVAKRAGKDPVKDPLWALNWTKFGDAAGQPCLGDVLVFVRQGGGHVGLYVGEDKTAYHVLGGNQADKVCMTRIGKDRLRAARRPPMVHAPGSRRPYVIKAGAVDLSRNEA